MFNSVSRTNILLMLLNTVILEIQILNSVTSCGTLTSIKKKNNGGWSDDNLMINNGLNIYAVEIHYEIHHNYNSLVFILSQSKQSAVS